LDKEVWHTETFFVLLGQKRAPRPLTPTGEFAFEGKFTMATAYVLLNTEIGAENQVLKDLKRIEGVKEAKLLWGVYDIIARINSDSIEGLKNIVTRKIQRIERINSKLTMLVTESQPFNLEENIFLAQSTIAN